MASVNDVKEQVREYLKLTQLNEVNTAGTVVKKYQSEPRPRMKDGVQMVDGNNNPLFYDPRRTCDFIYTGGEAKNVSLTKEQYESIVIGQMYIFRGRRASVIEYGEAKEGIVYDSFDELI